MFLFFPTIVCLVVHHRADTLRSYTVNQVLNLELHSNHNLSVTTNAEKHNVYFIAKTEHSERRIPSKECDLFCDSKKDVAADLTHFVPDSNKFSLMIVTPLETKMVANVQWPEFSLYEPDIEYKHHEIKRPMNLVPSVILCSFIIASLFFLIQHLKQLGTISKRKMIYGSTYMGLGVLYWTSLNVMQFIPILIIMYFLVN